MSCSRNCSAPEDNGELYGPEGKALADFVKDEYERRPTLRPAVRANGSGAPPSNYVAPTTRVYTTEDITGGKLSPKEMAEATKQMAEFLPRQ